VRIVGEIAGEHPYSEAFGPGWYFELTPESGGWRIQILDRARLDLSQMTPPLHGRGGEGETPPVLVGEAITIGKEDSSSALLYWTGDAWSSCWLGD
jgi:hypothetical protein